MLRFSPNPNLAHLIHWFEWEDAAFKKAREQDKPVMLFLSAFWCRYCQRMDEGALSDRENMALLNAYFVALRVENATRPDIDARYNLNGWPTIAFFTPSGELLAASNFLPVEEFKELLLNVYMDYQQRDAASRVTGATVESESPAVRAPEVERSHATILNGITNSIRELADSVNGGYGRGQKFIHAQATDFLFCRYEATKDRAYLDHACLTLDRMREGRIHDVAEGGYFRTTTGADWSQPHREKLLAEQAGMISNCLAALRFTGRGEYARMAGEIIDYLDRKLFDSSTGAFFGCEDFLRRETAEAESAGEFFSIIDDCIYTDANALAAGAYLEAAALLDRADCNERALNVIEFLWTRCRSADQGMYHYYDGAPSLPGRLDDQVLVGTALVQAYRASANRKYLERARQLAEFVIARLKNPGGGYFDLGAAEVGFGRLRLTDMDQNGAAASFFLTLVEAAEAPKYHEAALWALRAASGDAASYGIYAARLGRALAELLSFARRGS
ncbi:MAG: DUF255 domain-containing protein [Candidatus Binatia bacterium]